MSTTTSRTTPPPRPVPRKHPSQWRIALPFLLPALILLVLLRAIPTVSAILDAFPFGGNRSVWSNFSYIFTDPSFWGSVKITLLFAVIINPVQIVLALVLAVALSKKLPAVGLWRTLILLPIAIPQVVSAIVWLVLFRPDGPLNAIVNALGLPSVPWLTSPGWALTSVIIVCSWVGVGYWMTFLVTGLQEIPDSLYEASALDGAGAVRQFFSITIPGLRRQLLFVLVADTVSNFLVFAPVRILTQGGPQGGTDLIMYNITDRAYTLGDTQAASAATLVLMVLVIIVVAIQFRLIPEGD
jgi:multiple sugar transport system permease protein